jgi:pre-mRNA cleavage complex 2 protein Pcf11
MSSTSAAHNTNTSLNSKSNSAAAANKVPYLPVPEDSSRVNSACPICQEKFEMKWLDEAQEWVWMDAVKVGERVFHASCHREAYGAAALQMQQQQVQQQGEGGGGVLGKRKAEVCLFVPIFSSLFL